MVNARRVVACPTFTFTLNWDRRIMAGAQAVRFFRRIIEILEEARTELAAPSESESESESTRRVLSGASLPSRQLV